MIASLTAAAVMIVMVALIVKTILVSTANSVLIPTGFGLPLPGQIVQISHGTCFSTAEAWAATVRLEASAVSVV